MKELHSKPVTQLVSFTNFNKKTYVNYTMGIFRHSSYFSRRSTFIIDSLAIVTSWEIAHWLGDLGTTALWIRYIDRFLVENRFREISKQDQMTRLHIILSIQNIFRIVEKRQSSLLSTFQVSVRRFSFLRLAETLSKLSTTWMWLAFLLVNFSKVQKLQYTRDHASFFSKSPKFWVFPTVASVLHLIFPCDCRPSASWISERTPYIWYSLSCTDHSDKYLKHFSICCMDVCYEWSIQLSWNWS